jgi:hypothetical protein
MANLTKVEKQLLNFAIKEGKLTITDFYNHYKSKEIIRSTVERFQRLGLIKEDLEKINEFIIDIEKINNTLKGGQHG